MTKELKDQFEVSVKAFYDKIQSDPEQDKFVWRYEISILNKSDQLVQLLTREWNITDMTGHVENLHGTGVIGLQPILRPEKLFSYTSYCQITTPQGTMEGFYEMETLDEQRFSIGVPKFILSAPRSITKHYRSQLH